MAKRLIPLILVLCTLLSLDVIDMTLLNARDLKVNNLKMPLGNSRLLSITSAFILYGRFIGQISCYTIVTNKKEANIMGVLIVIGIILYIPFAVIFNLANKYK